jgi:MerR family transcriptional regulator, light-induced transcriptional regulator
MDKTPRYNLKVVTRETGLSPEVLRAWERRYGVPKPHRTGGGHRLYSDYDIQVLKWLTARQAEGMSISRAVDLLMEGGERSPNQILQRQSAPPPGLAVSSGPALEELRQGFVAACLDFDEARADAAISEALAISSPETAVVEILQKGLYQIGELWYSGQVSVQQEHFASSLAMRRLHALNAASPAPTRSETALAACPPGEEHEFGLLLLATLLRRRGYGVVYLGGNVPLNRLEEAVRSINPAVVVSLAQTLPAAAGLKRMGELLWELETPLLFGGGVFSQSPGLAERIPGRFLGNELPASIEMIEKIMALPVMSDEPHPVEDEYQQAAAAFSQYWHLIEHSAFEQMQSEGVMPSHLEIAAESMAVHLRAALALGDLCLLTGSFSWVEGLVGNFGLERDLIRQYARAFASALEQHLSGWGQRLEACLESDQRQLTD